MLKTAMGSLVPLAIIAAVSAANTAAATSGWVAIPKTWEGDVLFLLGTGDNTGSMASILQTADDSGGTGARTVTFNDGAAAFTGVATDGTIEQKTVTRGALGTHIKFVGTVTTGPTVLAVTALGAPKYA